MVGLVVGGYNALSGIAALADDETVAVQAVVVTVLVIFVFPLRAIAVLTLDCLALYALITQVDEFEA